MDVVTDDTVISTDDVFTSTHTHGEIWNEEDHYPWLKVTRIDQCDESFTDLSNYIQTISVERYDHNTYLDLRTFLYQFLISQAAAADSTDTIIFLQRIFSLFDRIARGGFEDGLAAVEEIHWRLYLFQIPESTEDFDAKLYQACDWLPESVRQKAEIDRSFITQGREALFEAKSAIQQLGNIMDSRLNIRFGRSLLTDTMVKYLDKDITKQELSHQFFCEQNVIEREALYKDIKDMEDVMQRYQDQIYLISDYLYKGYAHLYNYGISIINDSSVHLLELVKQALTVESLADWAQDSQLEYIIENIPIVIRDGPIKAVNRNVTEPLLDMQRQLRTVKTNLRVYEDSIKMDSQFYL